MIEDFAEHLIRTNYAGALHTSCSEARQKSFMHPRSLATCEHVFAFPPIAHLSELIPLSEHVAKVLHLAEEAD